MPEFILDRGTAEASKTFDSLDEFTQGYIEAMFFTSASSSDDGELEGATVAELAPETLANIIHDCELFQREWREDIDEAIDYDGKGYDYDEARAGHDFWYSRQGHGVGYWDRGLGDVGDRLDDHAKKFTARDLYRGDDGLIYLA